MEILLTYLITIIFSILLDFYLEIKVNKDLYDNGYKYKEESISNLKDTYKEFIINDKLTLFIPIVNILLRLINIEDYNNKYIFIINELESINTVERLNKFEEEIYNENPTWINALLLPKRMELIKNDCETLNIYQGKETGTIYYETDDLMEHIKIIDADGDFKGQNNYVLSEKIKKNWLNTALKDYINKIDSINYDDDSNTDIIIDDDEEDIKKLNLSYEEKRNILLNFRNKLLLETQKRKDNNIDDEIYIKKLKK